MRITILPKTFLGWWSVGLSITWILFFILFSLLLGPGPDYDIDLAYFLTTVNTGAAVAALITGLISIFRRTERSVLVLISAIIGTYGLIGGTGSLLGFA